MNLKRSLAMVQLSAALVAGNTPVYERNFKTGTKKTQLTTKQKKVRRASKAAKKARRINRK